MEIFNVTCWWRIRSFHFRLIRSRRERNRELETCNVIANLFFLGILLAKAINKIGIAYYISKKKKWMNEMGILWIFESFVKRDLSHKMPVPILQIRTYELITSWKPFFFSPFQDVQRAVRVLVCLLNLLNTKCFIQQHKN